MSDENCTIEMLKEAVQAFVAQRDWQQFHNPKNLAMALACEAAELMEPYLWVEGEESFALTDDPKKRVEIQDEIADIAILLVNLCSRLNVDLSDALMDKLKKAEAKYPADKVRGKSLKYNEYD